MGNAGEARLDVVAMGRDEVTVVMNKVSAELDALKAKLAGYEKAQKAAGKGSLEAASGSKSFADSLGGVGEKLAGIKDQAGPVNKLREAFDNLRGNAGFAFGAITAAAGLFGAAIEGLTGDLFKGSFAMRKWDEARQTLEEGAKRTEEIVRGLRAELDRLQGIEGPTKLVEGTAAANARILELQKSIIAGDAAVRELKGSMDSLTLLPGGAFAQKGLVDDIRDSNRKIVELKQQQIELNNLLIEGERERTIEAMRSLGPLLAYLRGTKAAANNTLTDADLRVDPTLVPGYVAPDDKKPRGGGRGVSRKDREAAEARKIAETWKGVAKDVEDNIRAVLDAEERFAEQMREIDDVLAEQADNIAGNKGGNFASALSDTELAARAASDAFDLLATSGASLEAVLPGLSGAFGEIAAIWDATDGSAKSMAQGVLGSVDAIANAGAAWIKDEKARTRFLGAKELLLAAPLWFIDPAQAAVRTATGIGLLALGGGGGGGASGGARGSSGGSAGYVPDARSGGGASTVVHHWSTFVSDPHTVQRMLATSSRATARTGLDTRNAA